MARSTAALVAGGDVAVAHHEHLPVANALQREDTLELIARETLEQAAAAAAVEPGERCAGVAYAGRYGLPVGEVGFHDLELVCASVVLVIDYGHVLGGRGSRRENACEEAGYQNIFVDAFHNFMLFLFFPDYCFLTMMSTRRAVRFSSMRSRRGSSIMGVSGFHPPDRLRRRSSICAR